MKQQQTSTVHRQRRRYFVDRFVQGRLVISLILLELVIFSVAMWFVYTDLQHHIDVNLYRVHQVQTDSMPVLLNSLQQIVPWILLLNVIALIIIDKVWAAYIRKIVDELEHIFSDLKKLIIKSPEKIKGEHEVIGQAKDWLRYERQRNEELHKLVAALPEDVCHSDEKTRQQVKETLEKIQDVLPKP